MTIHSSWDHLLLRKYNSTSHYRLLKQLRAELIAHPLKRLEKQEAKIQSNRQNQTKDVELKIEKREPEVCFNNHHSSGDLDLSSSENKKSFKQRLNDVQMK